MQAILLRLGEVEQAHAEQAGLVRDAADQAAASPEQHLAAHNLTLDDHGHTQLQSPDRGQPGAVLVFIGQVKQQVADRVQANTGALFSQLGANAVQLLDGLVECHARSGGVATDIALTDAGLQQIDRFRAWETGPPGQGDGSARGFSGKGANRDLLVVVERTAGRRCGRMVTPRWRRPCGAGSPTNCRRPWCECGLWGRVKPRRCWGRR